MILLGWDGVQRNHLYELLDRGLMPNLSTFIQSGKIVNVTVTDHYTDTKAGWTQILTGYKWWKTGVFNNVFWFNSIPLGYTIPERLENIYGKGNMATAFITGKINHMETINGYGTASKDSPWAIYTHEAIYSNLPSQIDLVSAGNPDNGIYNPDNDRYADVVGPLTLQFLQNNSDNHFFAFFHFSDPDHIGHKYGENSAEYENAIETCDYWLGQISAKLNTLNLTQNTLIYITADHGFDEGAFSHYNAPYIFLATNDKNVTRNGDEVDVAPTIYYGLGLWNQTFTPSLDGYPLQISLPSAEAQKRQTTLADTAPIPTPKMNITDGESNRKTVTFTSKDNNLAAVLLLVDNRLKCDGPWNWTRTTSEVTATGSYNINITGLSMGSHTITIFAFDEHGAYNGGTDIYPGGGGSPGKNIIDFYVGPETSPLPSPSSTPLPAPTAPPSPTPNASSSSLLPSPSPPAPPSQSAPPLSVPSSSIPAASLSPITSPVPTDVGSLTLQPSSTPSTKSTPSNLPTSSTQSPSSTIFSSPPSSSTNSSTRAPTQTQIALSAIAVIAIGIGFFAFVRKRNGLRRD